jgi:hypothetical protein
VLVALSLWEGPSGVVVHEGLGCRTPVDASRAGGIRDLIAAVRTGPPASTNGPPALADAIERAPIELDLQESTAGARPRIVAGRHIWRLEDEQLLPGCEGVRGPHETSIG